MSNKFKSCIWLNFLQSLKVFKFFSLNVLQYQTAEINSRSFHLSLNHNPNANLYPNFDPNFNPNLNPDPNPNPGILLSGVID